MRTKGGGGSGEKQERGEGERRGRGKQRGWGNVLVGQQDHGHWCRLVIIIV